MVYWQKKNILEEIGNRFWLDRAVRFHPLTVAMAVAWMKVLSPLTHWITPQQLLKAMFAAVGAVGVWAAMSAFAAVVPRRHVALWGSIYASSLGVWYFSSIEESKIVTTTLTALYIAAYLQLRKNWTMRGAVLLTAILLAACLNEIVAAFLVVIPAVDTLVRRGWDLRQGRWIGLHGLVAPMALVFLEGVVNGHWASAGGRPPPEEGISDFAAEGASHLSMLLFYVARNDYSADKLYAFLANWLFFNMAAPTPYAREVVPLWPNDRYFEPILTNYFSSPAPAALVALFVVILIACVLSRYRAKSAGAGMLLAFGTYTLLRGMFFFIVNPEECLLFSSGVTLAHVLLIAIPFAASPLPGKGWLLAAMAFLLLITNGTFILGG
jgi:hypothetical protein